MGAHLLQPRAGGAINNELLLAWIQTCIEEGRYHFTDHALTKHTMEDGFTPRQALEAIQRGTVIERRDDECRCLLCGEASGLRLDPKFVTTYIHSVIRWDSVREVVVITMYRPKSTEWQNQFTRRRQQS